MNAQAKIKATSGKPGGLFAVKKWAGEVGMSPLTVWRMRRRGWLDTVNIGGRVYITTAEIERFTTRAAAGEFAKEHKGIGHPA